MAELTEIREVRIVLRRPLDEMRRSMGWSEPDFGRARVQLGPTDQALSEPFLSAGEGTVQVFSEFVADQTIRGTLDRAAAGRGLIGLLSEGRDWRGLKGSLRSLHSFACERRYAGRADFVLAIGHLSRAWFLRCGFDPERIFDFAYVVERPEALGITVRNGSDRVQLLYVGRLISLKRVDVLLQALGTLGGTAWTLRVIGDGPERAALVDAARRAGVAGNVRFLGTMDNLEVRKELARADVLVLPSHWDGWGAVVNEALAAGTRAVCSDFCGAADLLRGTPHGAVFTCDSPDSLAAVLREQIARGPVSAPERRAIQQYAETVSGPSVARYLWEVIEFVAGRTRRRPVAPWIQRDAGTW
jgi:glycosyltransferase involved in cell wall biosynthesis